jgi:hypothetical protein
MNATEIVVTKNILNFKYSKCYKISADNARMKSLGQIGEVNSEINKYE